MTAIMDVVVGVGIRPGADPAALRETVACCLDEVDGGVRGVRVTAIGTLDSRVDHRALVALADGFGVPSTGLSRERLAAQPVARPSSTVAAAVGTPSVAEAAVLALGGELLVPKTVGDGVTVAIGRLPDRTREPAVTEDFLETLAQTLETLETLETP